MTVAPIVLSDPVENDASNSVNIELPFIMPPKDTSAISEKTQISVGVLIALGGLFLGSGGAWVWWMSNVSTRLSSIESFMANPPKSPLLDDLNTRLKMIEAFGAVPTRSAIDQLSKDISDLRRTLELQQARSLLPPGGGGGGK